MGIEINPISWSSDLEAGISWQDNQHRELFQVFQTLYEKINFGRGKEQAQKIS